MKRRNCDSKQVRQAAKKHRTTTNKPNTKNQKMGQSVSMDSNDDQVNSTHHLRQQRAVAQRDILMQERSAPHASQASQAQPLFNGLYTFNEQTNQWTPCYYNESSSSSSSSSSSQVSGNNNNNNTFSTISYNVWFDAYRKEERYEQIFKICKQKAPNVICFQEVTKKFLEMLEKESWVRDQYLLTDVSHSMRTFKSWYGVLSLVKKKKKNSSATSSSSSSTDQMIIGAKSHILESAMGRTCTTVHLKLNGREVMVGNVHLESLGYPDRRYQQLDHICSQILKSCDHTLLMGDFNFDDERNWDPEKHPKLENDIFIENEHVKEYMDVWKTVNPNDPGKTFDTDVNPMIGDKTEIMRYDRVILKSKNSFLKPSSMEMIGTIPYAFDEHLNSRPVCPSDHFGLYSTFIVSGDPSCTLSSQQQQQQQQQQQEELSLSSLMQIDLIMNNILQYLPRQTLAHFMTCHSSLYQHIVNRDFLLEKIASSWEYGGVPQQWIMEDGSTVDPSLTSIEQLKEYMFNYGTKISVLKMYICHLGNMYWKREANHNSMFGEVAKLHSVCWVQIDGSKKMFRGKYRVKWRYHLDRSTFIDQWNFKVHIPEGRGTSIEYVWTQNHVKRDVVNQWQYLDIGTIEVLEPTEVSVHIQNFSGQWKHGVSLDHVYFEAVEHTTR